MAIKLNGIFKDGMVFQWGAELRVFGTANHACTVRCDILDGGMPIYSGAAGTEEDGSFLVCVTPTEEPGGPYQIAVYENEQQVCTINDAYAGEVWLASGEGNMEYPLSRTEFAKFVLPKIEQTDIRLFNVPFAGFMDEAQAKAEDEAQWVNIGPETAGQMSGIAFYFGFALARRLDAKIGIISCCAYGSTIDCWTSVDNLMQTKEGLQYIKDFEEEASEITEAEYEEEMESYGKAKDEYEERLNLALSDNPCITYKEADISIGPLPWPPPVGKKALRRPGSFFECMLLRVAPYTLRGVIFYQGEADTFGHQNEYGKVFESLIKEWRSIFFDDELPFLFCQLPMYISKDRKYMGYDDMSWPTIREQQQIAAIDIPGVYMAVIADCGEFDNMHPSDKKTPGDRLALLAQKFVYGFENVDAVAPYIVDARRGEGVEVTFGGDYMLLNIASDFGGGETGFEIAGDDGEFFPADATVDFDGKTVLLSSPKVENPCKVRYAYFSYGPTPLHAQNGLTATPFQVRIDKDLGGV
ncbi:MAG: sialate O-acetylesterase [Saccharofermentans sp.]|nr:sialate O-acetylesterase [Saccharofermentans sp.]